jgi:hypothetical protein
LKTCFKRKENMMRSNLKFYGCLMFFLMVSFSLFSGCNEPAPLQSKWADKDIVIDANDDEWKDINQYNDEKTKTTIGVLNDESNVYMCLTTSDLEILNSFIKSGFIIWLNGTGAKDKQLGIRFPVVEQAGSGGKGAPGGPGANGGPGGPGGPGEQGGSSVDVSQLKILTSEKDKGTLFKVDELAKKGVSARIAMRDAKLVYELKMPLNKTEVTPYAVEPSAAHNIGAGFMIYSTAKKSASGISGFGGGIDMSGSSSGGGGGGPGGGGGGPGGGGGGMDSRDSSFSTRDVSEMNNIYNFFGMNDDDLSNAGNDNVSIINAQGPGGGGGGPGGGGPGGGGGGDMGGGSDMGGSMGSPAATQTKLEVWFNITLATK